MLKEVDLNSLIMSFLLLSSSSLVCVYTIIMFLKRNWEKHTNWKNIISSVQDTKWDWNERWRSSSSKQQRHESFYYYFSSNVILSTFAWAKQQPTGNPTTTNDDTKERKVFFHQVFISFLLFSSLYGSMLLVNEESKFSTAKMMIKIMMKMRKNIVNPFPRPLSHNDSYSHNIHSRKT